jgi:hypothetical protein
VIAGTASAVSGRVQRRQAENFASRDAQIYADRQQAYQQVAQPQPQYAQPQYAQPQAAPAPAAEPSMTDQLKQLADLQAQGVLSAEEFAAAKAKLLGI